MFLVCLVCLINIFGLLQSSSSTWGPLWPLALWGGSSLGMPFAWPLCPAALPWLATWRNRVYWRGVHLVHPQSAWGFQWIFVVDINWWYQSDINLTSVQFVHICSYLIHRKCGYSRHHGDAGCRMLVWDGDGDGFGASPAAVFAA